MKLLDRITRLFSSRVFLLVVAAVILLGGFAYAYMSLSNSIHAEQVKRGQEILDQQQELNKILTAAKSQMEYDYKKRIATMQQKLNQISVDRNRILARLNDVEKELTAIQKERKEVESHVYTMDELDAKFSYILQRGKR